MERNANERRYQLLLIQRANSRLNPNSVVLRSYQYLVSLAELCASNKSTAWIASIVQIRSERDIKLAILTLNRGSLPKMDNSTIFFFITIAVVFLVLKWFIKPIPQSVPEEFNIPDRVRANPDTTTDPRQRRQVTESMIEVVQAIGPQLSASQIRYSLENSGSVEATIEMLMQTGSLPLPPDEVSEALGLEADPQQTTALSKSKSLWEKYNLDSEIEGSISSGERWGKDENERSRYLTKRKAEMINRARDKVKAAK